MTDTPPASAPHSFPALAAELGALRHLPRHEATSGHCALGANGALWLSIDHAGQGRLAMAGTGTAARLTLEQGDSGRWASLGFLLDSPILQNARYFAFLMEVSDCDLMICTPTLRYRMQRDHIDRPAEPLVITTPAGQAPQTCLTHIPLDPALLARSEICEFNLFFQSDAFHLQIHRMDPAIMY